MPRRAQHPRRRAVLVAIALRIAAAPVAAQEAPRPSSAAPPSTELRLTPVPDALAALEARRTRARAERDIGWVLSGVGLATFAVGVAVLGASFNTTLRFEEGAADQLAGGIAMGVGALVLIPGIVMAVHGQDRITDADFRIEALHDARAEAPSPRVLPLIGWLPGGFLAGARLRF